MTLENNKQTDRLEKKIDANFKNLEGNIKKIFDQSLISYIKYLDNDVLIIYDKQDNMLLKAKFQEIGSYDFNTKIWVWSWNKIPTNNLLTSYSKNVKKYSKKLFQKITKCKNMPSCMTLEKYYYMSKYGNFYFSDDIMQIIKYALFVTNSQWYLNITHMHDKSVPKNKIHCLFITNVLNY